jgi:hypothetical protein
MKADYADDAGGMIPVEFDAKASLLPFTPSKIVSAVRKLRR